MPAAGFVFTIPTSGAATAPIDGPWAFTPTCGAWLSTHLWDHFLFTRDTNYLADVYPALKGAAEFFLDYLVEEPTHKWRGTCPSASPENSHPKRAQGLCRADHGQPNSP